MIAWLFLALYVALLYPVAKYVAGDIRKKNRLGELYGKASPGSPDAIGWAVALVWPLGLVVVVCAVVMGLVVLSLHTVWPDDKS